MPTKSLDWSAQMMERSPKISGACANSWGNPISLPNRQCILCQQRPQTRSEPELMGWEPQIPPGLLITGYGQEGTSCQSEGVELLQENPRENAAWAKTAPQRGRRWW